MSKDGTPVLFPRPRPTGEGERRRTDWVTKGRTRTYRTIQGRRSLDTHYLRRKSIPTEVQVVERYVLSMFKTHVKSCRPTGRVSPYIQERHPPVNKERFVVGGWGMEGTV